MAKLNLSIKEIRTWLKTHKPLQDMTKSELDRAEKELKLPRETLLLLSRATDFDDEKVKSLVDSRRLDGEMTATPFAGSGDLWS